MVSIQARSKLNLTESQLGNSPYMYSVNTLSARLVIRRNLLGEIKLSEDFQLPRFELCLKPIERKENNCQFFNMSQRVQLIISAADLHFEEDIFYVYKQLA